MSKVVVYTTPYCPYCFSAKRLLSAKHVEFEEIDVSRDPQLRGEMMQKSGRRTVPQIFIDGISVGGSDEIHALDHEGKLDAMLATVNG
jgi:glutaredoxin 3